MSRVGIYSGSFDPIHVGHVEFALAAIKQAGLDKVYFLPETNPRQKELSTTIKNRTEMIQLGLAGHNNMKLLQLKDERFSVQHTLPQLQKMFAGSPLVFLMGSDLVKTFSYRWDGLDVLLASVALVIGLRIHDTAKDIHELLAGVTADYGIQPTYTVLQSPRTHLASTHIRQGSHDITDIDSKVADYIKAQQLYKDSSDL